MVAELCQYVILGHSERRTYFGETDATVNKKVKAAFAHGLIPIVCVGETLEENETGKTAEVVSRQVKGGLQDLELADPRRLVIAYEPVWAIGTGKAATAQLANSIIGDVVRGALSDIYGRQNAEQVRILYGGSVKGSIAAEFFHQPEIDGALVGGASLKPADFLQIVLAAA
jgi:triosephosphate isomerase